MLNEITTVARLLTIKQGMIDANMPHKLVCVMEDVIDEMCDDYEDRTDGDLINEAHKLLGNG